MNVTRNQWLAIIAIVLNALVGASALWTQIFGPNTAQIVVSVLGVINTILAGVTYILTGQSQQIRDVAAMPGVERIAINANANSAVATVAIDPTQAKVGGISPLVQQTLQDKAKGN